jgi:hypothetical protein
MDLHSRKERMDATWKRYREASNDIAQLEIGDTNPNTEF